MKPPGGPIALLVRPSTCYVATAIPDGSPQLTQTWVNTDGERVLVNSVQGQVKVRNVERDPRVAVADPIGSDRIAVPTTTAPDDGFAGQPTTPQDAEFDGGP